jgi:hypothetical protein
MTTPQWLTWLAKIAPTVASAVGTPVAGVAVAALESALGITGGDGSTDKVQAAIESGLMTPDQLAALRRADQDFAAKMKSLDVDLEKLQLADVASARAMQVAQPSIWPGMLSAVTTLAVLAVIGARMSGMALPQDPTTVQLIGSLTTGWGLCLAYWFGTTHSSKDKDATIATIAQEP